MLNNIHPNIHYKFNVLKKNSTRITAELGRRRRLVVPGIVRPKRGCTCIITHP
jgi:hypothetical protein